MASRANGIDTSSALLKYGYQVWLSADRQRFFLQGGRGQTLTGGTTRKSVVA
jgi:hypothetical protein